MSTRNAARYAPIILVLGKPAVRRTGGILTRREVPKKGVYDRKVKHRGRDMTAYA